MNLDLKKDNPDSYYHYVYQNMVDRWAFIIIFNTIIGAGVEALRGPIPWLAGVFVVWLVIIVGLVMVVVFLVPVWESLCSVKDELIEWLGGW